MVLSPLRTTWALLTAALLAALLGGRFALPTFVDDVYCRCDGTIAAEAPSQPASHELLDVTATLPQRGGFALRILDHAPLSKGAHELHVARLEVDEAGRVRQCGSIPVPWPGGDADAAGIYYYPAQQQFAVEQRGPGHGRFVTFRAVPSPVRHLQAARALDSRHLPTYVALVALCAIAVGFARSRRAIVYFRRLHTWREGTLGDGGRVLADGGEALGVVAIDKGDLPRGTIVLVSPEGDAGSLYRDMRILERRDVALGSHAEWREAARRGRREAQVLSVVSLICTASAMIGQALGG